MISKFRPNNLDGYDTEDNDFDIESESEPNEITPTNTALVQEEKKQTLHGVDVSWCRSPFVNISPPQQQQPLIPGTGHTWFATNASSCSSFTQSKDNNDAHKKITSNFPTFETASIMTFEDEKPVVNIPCKTESQIIIDSVSVRPEDYVPEVYVFDKPEKKSIITPRPEIESPMPIMTPPTLEVYEFEKPKISVRHLRQEFFQKCKEARCKQILLSNVDLMDALKKFEAERQNVFFSKHINQKKAAKYVAEITCINKTLGLLPYSVSKTSKIPPCALEISRNQYLTRSEKETSPSCLTTHTMISPREHHQLWQNVWQNPRVTVSAICIFVFWLLFHYLFRPDFVKF